MSNKNNIKKKKGNLICFFTLSIVVLFSTVSASAYQQKLEVFCASNQQYDECIGIIHPQAKEIERLKQETTQIKSGNILNKKTGWDPWPKGK